MKCNFCGKEINYKYCFINQSKKKIMCKDCMTKLFSKPVIDDKGNVVGTLAQLPNFGQNIVNREYLRKRKIKTAFVMVPDNIMEPNKKEEPAQEEKAE